MKAFWKYGMLAISIYGALWMVDRSNGIYWVGSTNLEVVLCIKDRESGILIPHSTIEVRTFDTHGLPQGTVKDPTDHMYHFRLKADSSGIARVQCNDVTRSGQRSFLHFTNTYCVANPVYSWNMNISANGYENLTDFSLDRGDTIESSDRLDLNHDRMMIEITLKPTKHQ